MIGMFASRRLQFKILTILQRCFIAISIDGVDISKLGLVDLRKALAIIP
jgi:ABC-type multidrug transport system fused ATPase/permease subunit